MKKFRIRILAGIAALCLCTAAYAAAPAKPAAWQIIVNEKTLELGRLPRAPYWEGGTLMVPLRAIGEALGCKVGWDPKTRAITIDDNYIQSATLYGNTAKAVFKGELKIIDMSREVTNAVPTAIHSGCAYVPLEFFREFFNDTSVSGTVVTIAASMSELQTEDGAANP